MKMASILTLAVCLLLPLAATTASAANDGRAADQSSKIKVSSTAQAVQLVKHQYQGKVLRAQVSNSDGYSGYKVKMISKEGRVFYLFVDAQTGSISGK
ncbi:hypothetical protein CXF72_15900 [Psychromonas sp. MB-3u-54]|uniref:PepSY domain-containing protein n=1 Tax=Psychromonas sp. MB-3u-54 TaxID=2058319 RepID=UPI000C3410EE|nr:PepSY domain-containing protein [Psychromonas sp. MB-3u-54]PKH01558.1 hypothetical protein CXF72_15900 [Psychromonas sp. MB-3u-54]